MSYGYLIVTTAENVWLTKERYDKFEYLGRFNGLYFYNRIDETDRYAIKKTDEFSFTNHAFKIFHQLNQPMYVMHYLLRNHQSETDMVQLTKTLIHEQQINPIKPNHNTLKINQIYQFSS